MYIIRTKADGAVAAICSRLEDTDAWMVGSKESDLYVMEQVSGQDKSADDDDT